MAKKTTKIVEIRSDLKEIIKAEIQNIPSLLEQSTPEKRLEFLSKTIPLVLTNECDWEDLGGWN